MMSKQSIKSTESSENLIELDNTVNNETENVEDLKKKVKFFFINMILKYLKIKLFKKKNRLKR